jgi:hypothetical protein
MSKKSDNVSIDAAVLQQYQEDRELLHEITDAVWNFSEPKDDPVDCVYRILEELYEHKAEVHKLARLLRKYDRNPSIHAS